MSVRSTLIDAQGDAQGDAERLSDRDAAAWVRRAYREHRDLVFHAALRCCAGDRACAEDITQDVFVQLLHVADPWTSITNLPGWLYRVAIRRALSRLSRERFFRNTVIVRLLGLPPRRVATPEELGIHDERLARATRALLVAPPKERLCFLMYHVDGTPMADIGAILGHSIGYVSKLIARAEARIGESDHGE